MGQPTICVIGRFDIRTDHGPQPLAGGLQRLLLALLAGSQGRWVPSSELAEALWPGAEPGTSTGRLHVHVHRLRCRLGPGTIEAGPDGYRLHLPEEAVDAWQFDQLAARTLTAHTDGTDETALLTQLDQAAACWRGEPYPGADHPLVAAERHRLTELYLLVEETRAQHRLDRGENRGLLEHLVPAALAHPTRERLHVLWMTALYRRGEHARALRVYAEARKVLAAELDAAPGPALAAIRALVAEATDASGSANGETEAAGGSVLPERTVTAAGSAGREPAAGRAATAAAETSRSCAGHEPGAAGGREWMLRDRLTRADSGEERALLRRELGMLLGSVGRLEESLELLFQAEAQYRLHGPLRAHRAVLQQLAMEMSKVGDLRRALRLLDEAQQTYPGGRPSDRLRVVRAIVLTHMKDADGAGALLAAGPAPGEGSDPLLTCMWWRAHSIVARLRGQQEHAIAAARTALQVAQCTGAPAIEGVVMVDLACALRDAEEPEADRWYRAAVRLGRRDQRPPLLALAEGSAAKAALLAGDPHRATVHAREALRHARQAGTWGLAGRASTRLADAAAQLGEPMRAGWYRQEALSQYRRVDFPLTPSEPAQLVPDGAPARTVVGAGA